MTQLITNSYRYNSAQNFVNSFSKTDVNGNFYYVFAGNHQPYANSVIPSINDDVNDTYVDVYRNMIFGKLVNTTDVSLVINRNEWQSGIVYAMYDDKDTNLSSSTFFVYVNGGSYYHVFKCLNNNNNKISTVQPDFLAIVSDNSYFSPVDGYTWKYMYSVDSTTFDKFSTDKFIPYFANTAVISRAVSGSIEAVKIISTGAGYDNYIVNGYFTTTDIGVGSNSYWYGISVAGASQTDDFYEGCILTITSGKGAGQYRQINYYNGTAANTKYVILTSPFQTIPDNTSTYSIYPGDYIVGDQTESNTAIGWAYVNPVGNTISRVELLSQGSNYKIATANVYSSPYVNPTSNASVRPILSPPGGHGANPANELYCSSAAISAKFNSTEGNTIPSSSQYRQIGVLLNPTFANVTVHYTSARSTFVDGEVVYNFYPQRIQNYVNVSLSNNIVTASNGGIFDTALSVNTMIYVSDGAQDQLFTVQSVTNSSQIIVTSGSAYDFSNAVMYTMNVQSYGTVSSATLYNLGIENLVGHIRQNAILVGNSSGGYTNSIYYTVINDQTKGFDTFIEAYRYTGSVQSGTIQINDLVTQVSNIVSNAVLHSVQSIGGVTNFFMTNQNGIFNTSNTIHAEPSGATATLTNKYLPEVVFGSGSIIYLENLDPITRSNTQTETFKLVFEF
jgi:hypothetical protein